MQNVGRGEVCYFLMTGKEKCEWKRILYTRGGCKGGLCAVMRLCSAWLYAYITRILTQVVSESSDQFTIARYALIILPDAMHALSHSH